MSADPISAPTIVNKFCGRGRAAFAPTLMATQIDPGPTVSATNTGPTRRGGTIGNNALTTKIVVLTVSSQSASFFLQRRVYLALIDFRGTLCLRVCSSLAQSGQHGRALVLPAPHEFHFLG